MSAYRTVAVVSDIHYASAAEQERTAYETRVISSLWLRLAVRLYRRLFWMRDPFTHNGLLERFLERVGEPDRLVANGDYSCDTAFVGLADDAAFGSATACLTRLRQRFGERLSAVYGDHELGKVSLFGGAGGLRLASWHRARNDLALPPFWEVREGRYVLLGVVSSLVALPVFEPETLVPEREEWWRLREAHLDQARRAFGGLRPDDRVVVFCHDPTALPFLWECDEVRRRIGQLEFTIIGHLHTPIILFASRFLAGMPPVRFLGNSLRRVSQALHDARLWRPFKVRLCPSLAGSELLKDGGYGRLELDPAGCEPARWQVCPLPR